ncbi:hypothetical protein BDL97_13G101600 [Sphagnum fallax]|nr:hypothetical protein BDL97_13G101600 [Sphagnum fallax]
MDDYMREMGDLKTLVTKTLEKKGVLARIRAELRANVFQAIEEQDREAENNGASSFALLGKCSERAKQLHASHAGKLLMALVCEYFEWCELEHTLKVFLPELNQPRSYMRSELEELLGLKDKTKLGDAESQPLLLSVVESYLKAEEKPTATANKVRTNSRGRAGDAGDGVLMSKLSGEFSKDNGKGGTKSSPNLEDFPAPKRTSSVPAFGGLPRSSATAPGRSSGGSGIDVHNGFNSLMSVGSATEISGAQTRGSRDNSRSSTTHTKGREYYRREEDEVKSGSNGSKKKENAWREEEYNDHYVDSPTVSQSYSDKGGPMSVVQPANRSGSQSRKGLSVDDMSNAVGNLHLEDDSASDPSSRHSSTSRENIGSRNRQPASASTATSAPSNYRKKNSSAYFYSDSDNDNSFEGIEEDLEDEVEEHNRRSSHFSAVK